MAFAENLKAMRQQCGLTQVQAADMFGISQNTISLWENGRQEPSIKRLLEIAKVFGTDINYLIGCDPGAGVVVCPLCGATWPADPEKDDYALSEGGYRVQCFRCGGDFDLETIMHITYRTREIKKD